MYVSNSTTPKSERLTDIRPKLQWNDIDWKKVSKSINRLQTRITKAVLERKWHLVKRLQYLITHSFYAKLLAVRTICQNKGKRTAGVDGEKWLTSKTKMNAALSLSDKKYKAKPLKRIYIDKPGKKKKRPLGIPTMYDRAIQALYAFALGPVGEATADIASFGFRKYRSAQDACEQAFVCLSRRYSAQWILEGDIKGCFDNINHEWLLDNILMDRSILTQFLKAGFVYKHHLNPTKAGTPQGGIISPILAKGKVENPFSYLENHFIADNEFESFEDFYLKLLDFEKQVNNRIHTSTKKTPIELFNAEEIAVLSPLSNNRFIGVSEEIRKVSSDCLISVDGNRYSVPHIFACRDVWIRISQGRYLEVYSQSNKLMAKHTLEITEKGKILINKEHFQGYRGSKGTWNFLTQQFLTIAPDQEDFLKKLKAQKRINPSRHLTIIVEAAKHFSKKDIKNVIQLCDKYNIYRSDLFVDLLHKNSDPVFIPKLEQVNDQLILSPPGVIRSLDSYCTENFVERSGEI